MVNGTYTTGQVARICGVSKRLPAVWFDKGLLKGFRLPGGGHRRVPHENLVEFLEEHGIPLERLAASEKKKQDS